MQLICLDEQSFSEIRARGGLYVDKTKLMYNLFKTGKYFFIARPRRFGKSLLCSTLAELFAGNRELFKNTWIETSDWSWEKHPVIHLDMTLAAGANADARSVRSGMVNMLKDNAERLGIDNLKEDMPSLMLEQLIQKVYKATAKGVVVIIDEYDKPMLDTIEDKTRYNAIHKELAAFYSPLKPLSAQLRFVFMTGVFKFAHTSIFSGLNNLNDLTFDQDAADLFGYTEEEIRTFFAKHLEALASAHHMDVEAIMLKLQQQYNGYKFSINFATQMLSSGVYNPFAINYVFQKTQFVEQWFKSGTPSALVKKLEAMQYEGLNASDLVVRFAKLDQSSNPDNIDSLCLLYYAGYLTLKQYDADGKKVALDFPNAEVAIAMSDLLLPNITKKPSQVLMKMADDMRYMLNNRELDGLSNLLNDALSQLPCHMFVSREGYYQTVFFMLLQMSNVFALAEDMMHRGRMDISVQTPKTTYIFELKMDQSAAVAIQQIKDKNYAAKYRYLNRPVCAIGIRLSGEERAVQEVLVEEI